MSIDLHSMNFLFQVLFLAHILKLVYMMHRLNTIIIGITIVRELKVVHNSIRIENESPVQFFFASCIAVELKTGVHFSDRKS